MILEMRTAAEATKVAELTGGSPVPARGDTPRPSRRVSIDDLEANLSRVESVSVLFRCFEEVDGELVERPSPWRVTGASLEVEWPTQPERAALVRSHFGARRYAFNWALARVKADLEEKTEDPGHRGVPWTLPALRKAWNAEKSTVAPWWPANSKEAYASGIRDCATALKNWGDSRQHRRRGGKVGFPRFQSRHNDRSRLTFTTGAMRLEADRRHLTLPVIGTLRSKENTRRLERHLKKGNARLLSLTLSERWGRLFVSVNYAVRVRPPADTAKIARCGVDLGLRNLATIVDTDGNLVEEKNPAPLRTTLKARRRIGRQLSRRVPGSLGHRRTKAKLAALDRRAVHLRRDQWHQLSHRLVSTYREVVVEDLDLSAMKRSMGCRAFRRSVSDASLGMLRPLLVYKAERSATVLTVADRFYPSSQLHHDCGCRLVHRRKLDKVLFCAETGEFVDRDVNAAKNLRDWPGHASPGSVGAGAPVVSRSDNGVGDAGSDPEVTGGRERPCETEALVDPAVASEARTDEGPFGGRPRNPERGAE
jgi:putative transposase